MLSFIRGSDIYVIQT